MFVTPSPLWGFVALLFVHWVADFVFQSRWMSVNKSKQIEALSLHVFIYTLTLFAGTGFIFGPKYGLTILIFALVNGVCHFCTDFVTSRITSSLYEQKRYHDFFVVIGIDQFIHQLTLASTMWYWL